MEMENEVVEWYGGLLRDFVYASFETFQQTEDIHAQALSVMDSISESDAMVVNDKLRLALLGQSKTYRSHFRVLLQMISDKCDLLVQAGDIDENHPILQWLENHHVLVSQLHKSWYLIEVFILNPTRFVAVEFAAWLQESVTPCEYHDLLGDYTHPELSENYWSTIYQLAMRGNFEVIFEALQRHSEISLTLQGQKGGRHRFTGSLDRNQCQMLLDLFATHPYVELLPKVNDVDFQYSQVDNDALADWKQRVASLLDSALVMKIPELDTLFRILFGEQRTLETLASHDWALLTLSQLLFVYPSIMARSNLCRVVEESIKTMSSGDDALFEGFRKIMMGSVAETMSNLLKLAEKSMNADRSVPEVRTMFYLSISHLCRLLTQSSNSLELLDPWSAGTYGASFCEEILLSAAKYANKQLFPVQLVYDYLVACPTKGGEVLKDSLPSRRVETDEEAVEIANALRSAKFYSEARRVLTKRGMELLIKNQFPHFRRSIEENAALYPSRHNLSSASSMGEASKFFQIAGQYDMLLDLMDSSIYRCMHAVRMYKTLFHTLEVFPGPLVDSWSQRPLQKSEPSGPAVPFLTADDLDVRGLYYEDERNTLFENQWPGSMPPSYSSPNRSNLSWTAEQRLAHLQYALQEATSIVNVLDDVVETHWLRYPAVLEHLEVLKKYSRAISVALSFTNNICGGEDCTSPLRDIREAASWIAEILSVSNSNSQPRVNVRYWLHLLDLVLWFHNYICQREMYQSMDPKFVLYIEENLGADLRTKWCKGLFSKDQCQQFLNLLKVIEDCQDRDFIFAITATTSKRYQNLLKGLTSMYSTISLVDDLEQKEKNRFPERVAALKSKTLQINVPSGTLGRFSAKKNITSTPTVFASPFFQRTGSL